MARWEPAHGRFRFRHPWKQYLKVGAMMRSCAYCIETLSGFINSEVQVSKTFGSFIFYFNIDVLFYLHFTGTRIAKEAYERSMHETKLKLIKCVERISYYNKNHDKIR